MIRILDLILSILALIVLSPFLCFIFLLILVTGGNPIYIQDRLGCQGVFKLYKFRTMYSITATQPTHLTPDKAITPLGKILRATKIDELPQLYNVILGNMSLVGPRPCLPSQIEIIQGRNALGLAHIRPGLTGLAQIKNVHMSSPRELVDLDYRMVSSMSLSKYATYILLTVWLLILPKKFSVRLIEAFSSKG